MIDFRFVQMPSCSVTEGNDPGAVDCNILRPLWPPPTLVACIAGASESTVEGGHMRKVVAHWRRRLASLRGLESSRSLPPVRNLPPPKCLRTRRSTSGTMLFHGRHFLKMICATQVPIALSSGESDWYALTHAASAVLGLKHLARDLGRRLEAGLAGDANAAAGIGARRRVGKIRHLETHSLWLQKHLTEKELVLSRLKGVDNPADLGTKHLNRATIEKHVGYSSVCKPRCDA